MADPGPIPLLAVSFVGFGGFGASALREGRRGLPMVGLAALAVIGGLVQASIRSQNGLLVEAGVALILGSAVVVTRGHSARFWDPDPDQRYRVQVRSLILAAFLFIPLAVFYSDLVLGS